MEELPYMVTRTVHSSVAGGKAQEYKFFTTLCNSDMGGPKHIWRNTNLDKHFPYKEGKKIDSCMCQHKNRKTKRYKKDKRTPQRTSPL